LKKEDPETYKLMLTWAETDVSSKMKRPVFPGWESIENLKQRIRLFTEKILINHQGKSVAAISHGGFIKSCLVYYAGGSFKRKTTFRVNNASISIIDFYKGNSVIRLVNDISHTSEKISRERPLPL
jgi:broad specificity phosphatase PhoE